MKNDLFEKAKQAVAESRGAESWIVMYAAYTGLASQIGEDAAFDMLDSACREVAERVANEAVKADRGEGGHTETMKKMIMESPIGDIIKLPDVIEVKYDKKGGRVIFGAPVETINKLFLEPGKWVIEAWVIRHSEYVKKLHELESRPLPFPQQPDGI